MTIKQIIERNPALVVGVILAAGVAVAFVGCTPTTQSPISGEKVTEAQFGAEVSSARADIEARTARLKADAESLAAQSEAARAEFDRANTAIAAVVEIVGGAGRDGGGSVWSGGDGGAGDPGRSAGD